MEDLLAMMGMMPPGAEESMEAYDPAEVPTTGPQEVRNQYDALYPGRASPEELGQEPMGASGAPVLWDDDMGESEGFAEDVSGMDSLYPESMGEEMSDMSAGAMPMSSMPEEHLNHMRNLLFERMQERRMRAESLQSEAFQLNQSMFSKVR
jgi:hypothetical protein